MKKIFLLLLFCAPLGLLSSAASAQTVFTCSSFNTTSAPCRAVFSGSSAGPTDFFVSTATPPSGLVSGAINMVPSGSSHLGYCTMYQSAVNAQAFSTTFTFVPNGYNFAFVVQNANNNGSPSGFCSGAGGEGGFSQFAGPPSNIAPNNVFALQFDSGGNNCQSCGYTNGGVQWYQTLQNPALPANSNAGYLPIYSTNKVSVSSPFSFTTGTQYTPTGHTYGANVVYDGYTLTLNMWDATAGGSCPGASCFTQSWTGVNIPSIINGTTGFVGFTSGVGLTTSNPLYVDSFAYTVNSPTGAWSYTPYNANSTFNNGTQSAASPVFSVAPGSYSATQSVSISTSTSPNNYICYVLSASTPTFYPQPDNNGGCVKGTLYTGAVSIASSSTLYAMAGSNNSAFATGTANTSGLGPPSTLVAGTYTINPSTNPAKLSGKVTVSGKVVIQ